MEEKGNIERFLESRYFLAIIIVLVAIIAFCLGRVSKIEGSKEPVRVLESQAAATAVPASNMSNGTFDTPTPQTSSGQVVGSKNGTKYHLPSCPGAKQISEKNKITFNSIEEARAKGYTPASNCKGLK